MSFSTAALFLDKFKHLLAGDIAVKDAIKTSIQKRFKIELQSKDIKIKEGVVHITSHPALKNQIFMQQEAILQDINAILGGKLKNIR